MIGLTSERLHVRHGHAQDGELVGLAGQRAARGHHVRQLRNVGGHLVSPSSLNLAVVLSAATGQHNKLKYHIQ